MRLATKLALTAAIGVSLSGCQALFGPHTAHVKSAEGAQLASGEAETNPALDQGRQLLRAGRIAQAIEVLRVAQRDPESMADASNALGVAYAKLGRHDLADRYFRMAVAMAPGEARFAANMLRLQRDYDLAQRRNEEAAQIALRAEEEKRIADARAEAAASGKIQRVSRGQVAIRTQALPGATAPQVSVTAMADARRIGNLPATGSRMEPKKADLGNKPVEEVEAVNRAMTVDFGKKTVPSKAREVTSGQYPVRVFIGG